MGGLFILMLFFTHLSFIHILTLYIIYLINHVFPHSLFRKNPKNPDHSGAVRTVVMVLADPDCSGAVEMLVLVLAAFFPQTSQQASDIPMPR